MKKTEVRLKEMGCNKEKVDATILWPTKLNKQMLQKQLSSKVDFETFFTQDHQINPNVLKIISAICGYSVEEIEDNLMQKFTTSINLLMNWSKKRHGEDIEEVSKNVLFRT